MHESVCIARAALRQQERVPECQPTTAAGGEKGQGRRPQDSPDSAVLRNPEVRGMSIRPVFQTEAEALRNSGIPGRRRRLVMVARRIPRWFLDRQGLLHCVLDRVSQRSDKTTPIQQDGQTRRVQAIDSAEERVMLAWLPLTFVLVYRRCH